MVTVAPLKKMRGPSNKTKNNDLPSGFYEGRRWLDLLVPSLIKAVSSVESIFQISDADFGRILQDTINIVYAGILTHDVVIGDTVFKLVSYGLCFFSCS